MHTMKTHTVGIVMNGVTGRMEDCRREYEMARAIDELAARRAARFAG